MKPLHVVAADYETLRFLPGNMTPPAVCLAVDSGFGKPLLLNRIEGSRYLIDLLKDSGVRVVFHNGAYDLGVLAADAMRLFQEDVAPIVFEALDTCRIADTMCRQKIVDLSDGCLGLRRGSWEFQDYSLNSLSTEFLGMALDKDEDGWRERYGELAEVPLSEWPQRARDYPCADTAATRALYAYQQMRWGGARSMAELGSAPGVPSEFEQVRAAFSLHLTSVWGMRTQRSAVEELARKQDRIILQVAQEFACTGMLDGVKKKEKAVRGMVEADWVQRGRQEDMPRTETGQPSIAAEALRACADPKLRRFADLVEASWIKSNPVKELWKGVDVPINARYDELKKTGRTGCSGPNMQNWKRSGGIRECFVPRDGYLFESADYETLELRTLAQDLYELFGPTEMVKALWEDRDLHVDLAAVMLGITYEQAYAWYKGKGTPEQKALVKAKRQFAKAGNFGIPGGMGAGGLVVYAAGMGVAMSLADAEAVIEYYSKRWPEIPGAYFPFIRKHLGANGSGQFTHPLSGLHVGRVTFTEMSNSRFQGRAAHGAKRALYETVYRCYAQPSSALYGSRPAAFLHDEILAEVPEDVAHEAGQELAAVMVEQMRTVCPNIPIKVTPTLMRRWYKNAEPVYDERGRMIPWEPESKPA